MLLEMEYPSDKRVKALFTARVFGSRPNSFGNFSAKFKLKAASKSIFQFHVSLFARRRGISASWCVFFAPQHFKFWAKLFFANSRQPRVQQSQEKQFQNEIQSDKSWSQVEGKVCCVDWVISDSGVFHSRLHRSRRQSKRKPRAPSYLPNCQN